MLALDTNIVVRALVAGENPDQTRRARDYIARNCSPDRPAFIDAIVLCEVAWVLRGPFGYDRPSINHLLERLLHQRSIRVEDEGLAIRALAMSSDGMDFADAFIGLRNQQRGAGPTATFDRKAARSPLFHAI